MPRSTTATEEDIKTYHRMTFEDKVTFSGYCGLKCNNNTMCKNPKMLFASYCSQHKYYSNAKCSKGGCPKFRRKPSPYCAAHGGSKLAKAQTKCDGCKKEIRFNRGRLCAECVKTLTCKRCHLNPAIKRRGGVCSTCPLPYKYTCKELSCQNHRRTNGFCVQHTKKMAK